MNFKNLIISEIAAVFLFLVVSTARVLCHLGAEGTLLPGILTVAIALGVIVVSILYGVISVEDKAVAVFVLIPLVIVVIGAGLSLNDVSFNVAFGLIAIISIVLTIPLMKYCPSSLKIFSSLTTLGVVIFVFARCCHIFFGI